MILPSYEHYGAVIEHKPYCYQIGNGYWYSQTSIKGLGYGYTEWFQDTDGKYLLDNYYNYSLIFTL